MYHVLSPEEPLIKHTSQKSKVVLMLANLESCSLLIDCQKTFSNLSTEHLPMRASRLLIGINVRQVMPQMRTEFSRKRTVRDSTVGFTEESTV